MRIRMSLVIIYIRKEESSNLIYLNTRQYRFYFILIDVMFATWYL